MKTINLETIAHKFGFLGGITTHSNTEVTEQKFYDCMKEACRQALELAAENAEIATELKRNLITNDIDIVRSINKDSILNTINQIV